MSKIHWRDTFDVWPSFEVRLQLAPWAWRFRFYQDWDMTPSWNVEIGPLKIDFGANRGWFPLERMTDE